MRINDCDVRGIKKGLHNSKRWVCPFCSTEQHDKMCEMDGARVLRFGNYICAYRRDHDPSRGRTRGATRLADSATQKLMVQALRDAAQKGEVIK